RSFAGCQAVDYVASITCMTTAQDVPTAAELRPLVSLLGRLEGAFVAEFDRRVDDSPFCALSLAHARNVLQHLTDGELRASALVTRSGVTKQAISQQLAQLERAGYVCIAPDPADQRARLVALTATGRSALAEAQRIMNEIECDWSTHLGGTDEMA